MRWVKKISYILSIWTLILCFSIIILELIFGNWLTHAEKNWKKAFELNIIINKQMEYTVSHLYKSNKSKIIYTRDLYGLRQNCKDDASIDILTIGGSTTDQRFIDDSQTFQSILQNKLENYLNKDICISNAGVDGHSTFGHLKSFIYWFPVIPNLKPKHVILYIGINDAGIRNKPSGYDNNPNVGKNIKGFFRHKSAIYNLLRSIKNNLLILIKNIISHKDLNKVPAYAVHDTKKYSDDIYSEIYHMKNFEIISTKNTKNFSERLIKILEYIKDMNAKPICVSQPHFLVKNINNVKKGIKNAFSYNNTTYNGLDFNMSLRMLNSTMSELCHKYNGVLLNYANLNFEENDFYDFVHMTPKGTKKLANQFFNSYLNMGLIDDL